MNPATGRCVDINGKIGKQLTQNNKDLKQIEIVFKPELVQYWNSSFNSGRSRSGSQYKYIWENDDIDNFLNWYNYFIDTVTNTFKKNGMEFIAYKKYNAKYLSLKIQCHEYDIYNIKSNFVKPQSPISKAIMFALNPDTSEHFIIRYSDKMFTIDSTIIKFNL